MQALVERVAALTADEAAAFRTAALESGQHEAFLLLLRRADGSTYDVLLRGLPPAATSRVAQMVAEAGDGDAAAEAAADRTLSPLLEPQELLYYRGLLLSREARYAAALDLYAQAFRLGAGGRERLYNAACAAALVGDRDAAFGYLDRAVDAGWLLVDATLGDEDLAGLHDDARWTKVLDRMRQAIADRLASLPEKHVSTESVALPDPVRRGRLSVEEALRRRRSERTFTAAAVSLSEIGQLLWAAYGTTQERQGAPERYRGGLKTAPSAGALYPLEIYVVAGEVEGLASGVYRYRPEAHDLQRISAGDRRAELCAAALAQDMVRAAPVSLVYSAVFERTTAKYGSRGRERYVCMDTGHSAQNVYLQCVSLGLGTTAIGAFVDTDVQLAVGMTRQEEPLYVLPVGRLAAAS